MEKFIVSMIRKFVGVENILYNGGIYDIINILNTDSCNLLPVQPNNT